MPSDGKNEMSLETKIARYVELRQQIEELENQKKALMSEVLELLPQETPSVFIPGYRVKRASLLTIKTSLESAKQFGAVKMKEVVDKEKIKKLYLEGLNPPDVSEVHFIQVYAVPAAPVSNP
jgi:hypothetical protein